MATRQDRREQLKKERRKKQQRRVSGKRVTPGWVAPAVIAVAAVGAILLLRQIGVFEPPPPAITPPPAAVEKVGTKVAEQAGTHVADGQRVQYPQLPPTSGSHWNLPHAGWGVKDTPQDDERVVHNLEHGGVVISYKGLTPDDLANLKTLVRRFTAGEYKKVLLRPYAQMDNGIVLTAWNWTHRIAAYDEAVITRFVQGHYGPRGEAPEPNAS